MEKEEAEQWNQKMHLLAQLSAEAKACAQAKMEAGYELAVSSLDDDPLRTLRDKEEKDKADEGLTEEEKEEKRVAQQQSEDALAKRLEEAAAERLIQMQEIQMMRQEHAQMHIEEKERARQERQLKEFHDPERAAKKQQEKAREQRYLNQRKEEVAIEADVRLEKMFKVAVSKLDESQKSCVELQFEMDKEYVHIGDEGEESAEA